MSRVLLIRLLATLIGLGCYFMLVFHPPSGELPFNVEPAGTHYLLVQPAPDYKMPAGLNAGERIDLRNQDFAARTLLVMGRGPAGKRFSIVMPPGHATRTVQATLMARHEPAGARAFGAVSITMLLVLGLVTLWWGRDWLAWGLSLFAFATVANNFLYVAFATTALLPLLVLNMLAVSPLIFIGLYLTALALVRNSLAHRVRLAFGTLLAITVLGSSWIDTASNIASIVFGNLSLSTTPVQTASIVLFLLSFAVPIVAIMAGYRGASAERRLRIRWMLWSLVLFAGAVSWKNLAPATTAFWIIALWWLAILVSLGALLYAVLRHRVVVLSFVINRAIAFSLSAGLVIGLFALLQTVIEKSALNQQAGLFLTVVVSVAMGIGFDVVRGRINRFIELVFFRAQYRAAAALERFAAQCHFIESESELLDQTVDETMGSVGALGVALYERAVEGYRLLRSRGTQSFPETAKLDDRAFVALRAEHREQDLVGLHSAVGADGYVFPMTVRGTLLGALVCGNRTEHYTPAERALLARLSHEVGTALTALRARENETIVTALATGTTAVEALRTQALTLYKDRVPG